MNKTFTIFRSDGSKVPTLKKSFLVKEWLDDHRINDRTIYLEDGTKWTLIPEESIINKLKAGEYEIFCICSYQVHTDGNYVIARVFEQDTVDITDKDTLAWRAKELRVE
jgi:hypothetical protein